MAGLFNLAADRALHMSQPPPPKISIGIEIGQPLMGMAGGGGLSSVQKRMNIGGQPHKLAYINSDEASLLKQLGGLGEPVEGTRGVPAYIGVGDEAGISEDYGTQEGASMGGGFGDGMGGMGSHEEYTGDLARAQAAFEQSKSGGHGEGLPPEEEHAKSEGFFADLWSALSRGTQRGVGDVLEERLGVTPKDITEFGVKEIGGGILGLMLGPLGYLAGRNLPAITKALGLEELSPEEYAKQAKEEEEMAQLDTGLPEDTKIKKILDVGEEEEEGRWDKYYEDREDRDPYKGYEYILEDVYGPDWRDRLKEGII